MNLGEIRDFAWQRKWEIAGVSAAIAAAATIVRYVQGMPKAEAIGTIKVTSYNTLCPTYANSDWYSHIDPTLVDWKTRQPVLIDHILSLDSDVLALQEVEPALFRTLKQKLGERGYMGFYTQKIGHPDGPALFFKKGSFLLEGEEDFFFTVSGQTAGSWRPAQIISLKYKGEPIGIIHSHFAWDAHGELCYQQLQELMEQVVANKPEIKRWVILGDFNVEPDSQVVHYLKGQGFSYAAEGAEQITCSVSADGTWYAEKVDYIFYRTEKLKAEAERIEEIARFAPLPSPTQPSDHIAITARIAIME